MNDIIYSITAVSRFVGGQIIIRIFFVNAIIIEFVTKRINEYFLKLSKLLIIMFCLVKMFIDKYRHINPMIIDTFVIIIGL